MKKNISTDSSLLPMQIMIVVAVLVSIASGLEEVGQGVLNKKIEHYRQRGYSVVTAGSYPDTTLVSDDYVVVSYPFHDILTVAESLEIRMEAGTRLFFEPNVRFTIAGSVRGRYVVLNSVPQEHLYLGTIKTDTNLGGVLVTRTGRLNFSRAALGGADTPIVSKAPWDSISLKCIELRNPGLCPISVQGVCPPLNNPSCFSSQVPNESGVELDTVRDSRESISQEPVPDITTNRPVLREISKWATIGFGAVAVGAGIASYAYHDKAVKYRARENSVTSSDAATQARENFNEALDTRNFTRNTALGAAVLSAGFGVVFLVHF